MPTFRVTSPDGKTYEVAGPEGSTAEQAMAQVQAQLAAAPQQSEPKPKTPNPNISPNQVKGSVAGGIFMGLRDPIDGAAQLLVRALPDDVVRAGNRFNNALVDLGVPGLSRLEGPDAPNLSGLITGKQSSASSPLDRMVQTANEEYDESRKMAGRDGIDVARIGGNVANPLNRLVPISSGLTKAGLALRGGVQGGLSGLFQPVADVGDDYAGQKIGQVAVGAGAGAVGAPLIDKLLKSGGNAANALRARFGSAPSGPSQAEQVLSQAAQEGGFDLSKVPQSILDNARKEVDAAIKAGNITDTKALGRAILGKSVLGEDAGLMLGQMTRDPIKYAAELDLRGIAGAGKPIADRLALQNERLIGAVGKQGAAGAPDAYDAGTAAVKSLQALDKQLSSEVTAAYQTFRNASGVDVKVPMEPIAQKLGEVIDTFGKENIPSAVMQRLNSYGLMGGKQTKVFDLLEADKLIKSINANIDPMKGPQAAALGQLRQGLNQAIELADKQSAGATGPAADLLRDALSKAKARFSLHEAVPGLEAAAQNKGAQEAFVQQYITSKSAGIDTVEKMAKMLSPDALDSVKKNVLANILESAAPGAARGSDAAKFSQAGYRKALDAIGDRKLEILFGKEGLQQLRNIEKVSQWIQAHPPGSAVNTSSTGAAFMNLLSKVGGAPGINIARDSIQKFSQERAAGNALEAAVPRIPNVNTEELNALRRFVMPAATSGSITATSATRPERRN
jgi:hypothetical protein